MDRQLRYHPLFKSDVVAAADWYDERSPGLGDSFITNVRLTVDAVHEAPTRHSPSPLGVHYDRVDRFPYLILGAIHLAIAPFMRWLYNECLVYTASFFHCPWLENFLWLDKIGVISLIQMKSELSMPFRERFVGLGFAD